ncbi:MAG: Coenzyme F420 hydrogenase/dehydrogenase, beta subunit C-terminal domain [bacterium]
MSNEEIKSFRDLITEVQEKGICGKCGGCVSFCSAGELNALEITEDGSPKFIDEDKCLKCGICYLICPQIKVLNRELKEKYGWEAPIGPYRKLTSARTTNKKVRNVCTDGGVVTSLLICALKKHLIQGAIVSKKIGPFARQPVLVTQADELIAAAGSHFDKTLHLEEIGERYTTYSRVITEIRSLGKEKLESIAMVGTPCQIYTARKMQLLNVIPADIVTVTIGLFCMENFSFDEEARKKLEKNLKIKLKNVKKLNIKDDVIVTLEKGKIVHLPFEAVDKIARPACFACPDFASDYADISVGGLGSPDGYTTTIIRNRRGEKIYNGAKQEKFIDELSFKSGEDLRIHKTEMMAKIVSFAKRKKERAKRRLTGE